IGVQGEAESEGPSESECRPYIEKALKELETGEGGEKDDGDSKEDIPTVEITDDADLPNNGKDDDADGEDNDSNESVENEKVDDTDSAEKDGDESDKSGEEDSVEEEVNKIENTQTTQSAQPDDKPDDSHEDKDDSDEAQPNATDDDDDDSKEDDAAGNKDDSEEEKVDNDDSKEDDKNDSKEDDDKNDSKEDQKDDDSKEDQKVDDDSKEDQKVDDDSKEDQKDDDSKEDKNDDSKEEVKTTAGSAKTDDDDDDDSKRTREKRDESKEDDDGESNGKNDSKEDDDSGEKDGNGDDDDDDSDEDGTPEEELSQVYEEPADARPRDHIYQLLKLDEESEKIEEIVDRVSEITLRELKKVYENAIKPLETLYKYRDLSNRHFGDPEIFSKPLILFMGPWSGGKSSIINYLLDNEYDETSLRTGAEPSPAYFNILMYANESEILDGTQLAADYTFSGLQKFGQGLEERLKGYKLPKPLLEKVNIVEIPGILEVRKQVSRVFPFNDACQWFIDRADIIFLVYDPSKLDVGPETEAILDQLKGREHQTRIVLNKADQVKPEELMRVQGSLIWNISPLMSSAQPPIMYTTSLWSRPYEPWAPVRLLQAQERAFLKDLRSAVDKRIENKIASARRFAVRVRNHAKMVDCYLTTYYNHKSVFGNKKQIADQITEHPQDYHIYEGLSTLTNISRYDLPDPEVYRDFFKLNPLYEFQPLSATCTYFRGCPINRLDVAIAYDLPELVGKHKRLVEATLAQANITAPAS
ncbi:sarcalumenin-like, partial [Agrilus planipennis]|uniref:Sarcalumenin-like n=1 Tax=Agrilus planipennis TaxID=224129 RepID=A0A7F5R7M4_AGRPL